MEIPKKLLESYFCKWEKQYFDEFNQKLAELNIEPITFEAYTKLLTEMGDDDEWMTPYLPPRIR